MFNSKKDKVILVQFTEIHEDPRGLTYQAGAETTMSNWCAVAEMASEPAP